MVWRFGELHQRVSAAVVPIILSELLRVENVAFDHGLVLREHHISMLVVPDHVLDGLVPRGCCGLSLRTLRGTDGHDLIHSRAEAVQVVAVVRLRALLLRVRQNVLDWNVVVLSGLHERLVGLGTRYRMSYCLEAMGANMAVRSLEQFAPVVLLQSCIGHWPVNMRRMMLPWLSTEGKSIDFRCRSRTFRIAAPLRDALVLLRRSVPRLDRLGRLGLRLVT
mmetsp:Transcript_97940/g.280161  ORF Transcript_97940/g.280161 Transcript_97940/m.280161 type:complete len:221 (-) Transcript_97940:4381-5043(-)